MRYLVHGRSGALVYHGTNRARAEQIMAQHGLTFASLTFQPEAPGDLGMPALQAPGKAAGPPYPWCMEPDACAMRGYCRRNPSCGD